MHSRVLVAKTVAAREQGMGRHLPGLHIARERRVVIIIIIIIIIAITMFMVQSSRPKSLREFSRFI